MRKCPECGSSRSWAVTWKDVEVFNRFYETKGQPWLSDDDQTNFEVAEKVIECRDCGWEAPTDDEDEFLRWLNGEEFNDILDHMAFVGGLFEEEK